MRITLHKEPNQATYHDAAYEPYRSEVSYFLKECVGNTPAKSFSLDDNLTSGRIIVSIKDQNIACGALYRHDDAVCEIVNLYIKEDREHTEISFRLIILLISKARKAGYLKLRYSLTRNSHRANIFLSGIGFVAINGTIANPRDPITMELTL